MTDLPKCWNHRWLNPKAEVRASRIEGIGVADVSHALPCGVIHALALRFPDEASVPVGTESESYRESLRESLWDPSGAKADL